MKKLSSTLLVLFWFLGGCGADSGGNKLVTDDPCSAGDSRCDESSFQTCGEANTYVERELCDSTCDPVSGCSRCVPGTNTCYSGDLYECVDGQEIGELVQSCNGIGCNNGVCGSGSGCGADAVELIYVVDTSYNFYSFDPAKFPGEPFLRIGTLNCPAGPPLQGGGQSTPFSMSVDRNGRAWVLYNSGEIFYVSTQDASCTLATVNHRSQGFDLFGMGFASDSEDSNQETLFIVGGGAAEINVSPSKLGAIDPATKTTSYIGMMPLGQYSPELTGTGTGELWAYYPGFLDAQVMQLSKSGGTTPVQSFTLPSTGTTVVAWAFAHWGGRFYIFETTQDFFSNITASVLEFNPQTGTATAVATDTQKIVVGAGVSTCAPVEID